MTDMTKFTDEELDVHFERLACQIAIERAGQAAEDEKLVLLGGALIGSGEGLHGSPTHGADVRTSVERIWRHEARQMMLGNELNLVFAERHARGMALAIGE
jgi:hypothetical protein